MEPALTSREERFARAAVRRRRLFLILSAIGIVVAVALSVFYAYRRLQDPGYPLGLRAALVVLILLNARQNLRQYRYASVLAGLLENRGDDRTFC